MRRNELTLILLAVGPVVLLAFGVYLCTLSPSITWSHNGMDSGDFAAAVACHGVPHPTGYPTYLVLADLFAPLPWGDLAYRLNLLSASAGALSAGLIVLLALRTLPIEGESPKEKRWANPALAISALSAGFVFAFNSLVWSQAIIAEVYTLHIFFLLLSMLLAVWNLQKRSFWIILAVSVLFGLGMGVHVSLALVLPALLVLLSGSMGKKPLVSVGMVVFGAGVGLCVYLLIPWRASQIPPVNWGGASDWYGFRWLVTGQVYQNLVLALPTIHLPMRLAAWLRYLFVGLAGWGLPVAIWGIMLLWAQNRRLAVSSILTFTLYSVYAICYNTTDSYVYLLPASAVTVLWMAYGLHSIMQRILEGRASNRSLSRLQFIVFGAVIVLSLIALPWHWAEMDLSSDREAIEYAVDVIQTVDSGSIIVVQGDAHTFALWYARYGLRLREDVVIVNDALLQFDWYQTILRKYHADVMAGGQIRDLAALLAANIGVRPVYLSDQPGELNVGYAVVPFGQLWQVIEAS